MSSVEVEGNRPTSATRSIGNCSSDRWVQRSALGRLGRFSWEGRRADWFGWEEAGGKSGLDGLGWGGRFGRVVWGGFLKVCGLAVGTVSGLICLCKHAGV